MANELDELKDPGIEKNDVRVIGKQLPVTVGTGSKIFDIIWWFLPIPILGGIIWSIMKTKAKNYFSQLQQKIQQNASQIDNYLEQRVQILKNCAKLVDKAVDLDKSTFTQLAAYRSGAGAAGDAMRNDYVSKIESVGRAINIAVENYPDLRAHAELADAMQQNSYLQREITAAREVYNDTIGVWNRDIFAWPTKQIVAAKNGYTTRIPFAIDSETREAARGEFF